MENKNTFTYHYSAAKNKELELIRKKYLPKQEDSYEIIRRLDNRVQSAGTIPALCVGIIGVLIFGIAMCFGLGAIGSANWLSIPLGIVGVLTMLPAYPLYQRIRGKTKAQLTPEILRLSDELMKS